MSYDDLFDESEDYWVSQWGIVEYYDPEYAEADKRRVWLTRVDGIRQRYWVKGVFKGQYVRKRGRFNWSGSGSEIANAIALAKEYHFVPVGFVDLKARDFLRVPFDENLRKRIVKGIWITHGVDTLT